MRGRCMVRSRSQSSPHVASHAGSWFTTIPSHDARGHAAGAPPLPAHAAPDLPRQMRTCICGFRQIRRPRTRLIRPVRSARQGITNVGMRRARSCRCNNGMCIETMHFTSHYSRVDVVIYGATPDGPALCRDAVLVSTYAHGATCGQQSDARRPPTRS